MESDKKISLYADDIKNKIYTIRNLQVMLDKDLAELYQVETKALNQAVKRNITRFPENFMFKITDVEKNELVTK
ncbi:MAG: ORF6N domain-containing protein, partial [Candidatus Aenigmarchaeota archaeon]|nr:ORF6N domain-containing protein [Candidatus Aenigmarchaeota archaeon]